MSRNYDNWERLVAAVLRRELIWKICHQHSRTPSLISLLSSDFGSSRSLNSSFSNALFDSIDPKNVFFESISKSLPFQNLAAIKIGSSNSTSTRPEDAGELVHFHGSPFVAFSLRELLTAPSSVLGEELGAFWKTYIVRLKEGDVLAVKRLKRGGYSQVELRERARTIGSIEHNNVAKLRGCYLSQDENLGFFDYYTQGSVHEMLHGKTGENRVHLDWKARIRIAIGAANGLAHIHRQLGGTFIHGNVKSSNIFLNSQQFGCIADISPAGINPISKYHSRKVSEEKMFSQAFDVYSFGVVLIELISGRSPLRYYSVGGNGNETLVDWAIHNASDEWRTMLFDKAALKEPLGMQGMRDLLVVAMCCVDKNLEKRPNMDDVEHLLEPMWNYVYV